MERSALVGVTGEDGKSIFNGKTVTAFSIAEEQQVGKTEAVPFQIQERIQELGGTYVKVPEAWHPKVSVSGTLLTGQNSGSAKPLADELLKALQKQ